MNENSQTQLSSCVQAPHFTYIVPLSLHHWHVTLELVITPTLQTGKLSFSESSRDLATATQRAGDDTVVGIRLCSESTQATTTSSTPQWKWEHHW